MKAKLTQQKRKTSKSTYAAGELNISFSVTDRTTKYKINNNHQPIGPNRYLRHVLFCKKSKMHILFKHT